MRFSRSSNIISDEPRRFPSYDELANYKTSSMKSVHPGLGVWGRALSMRNVSSPRSFNAANRLSTSMASTRHHETSATDRVRPSPWSQHPLKVSCPSTSGPKLQSRSSNHVSAKRTAYIALGSNLGDRVAWIEQACNEMSARGIIIKRTSCLWETEPMYVLNQDNFINGACEVSHPLLAPFASCLPSAVFVSPMNLPWTILNPSPFQITYFIGSNLVRNLMRVLAGRNNFGALGPLGRTPKHRKHSGSEEDHR
jgi:hypothetical protein